MGRRFFFRVDSAGCEEVQSGVVEIEEVPAQEEAPRQGVIHITPRFNQQGSDARNASPGDWGALIIPGTARRMSEAGCAVALVANIAFTHNPQTTVTPETIRANDNYFSFGSIRWVDPLTGITIHSPNNWSADRAANDNNFPNTFADRFNDELMAHETPRYYVAIRIFVTGAPGTRSGQHWVGASEIVPRRGAQYVRISPTSSNDWEAGTNAGDANANRNQRGQRGWEVDNNNIYVPLNEVVGYRIFRLTP